MPTVLSSRRRLQLGRTGWCLLLATVALGCGGAPESPSGGLGGVSEGGGGAGGAAPSAGGTTGGLAGGGDGNPASNGGADSSAGSGAEPMAGGGASGLDELEPDVVEEERPMGVDVGTKVIHRLSNVQYDNTVRDLLQSELRFGPGFVHEEAEGFDNIAESLSMSPRQVEDYYRAAGELAADVFANPALRDLVFSCTPGAACARTMIDQFGARAFRRPLTEAEATRLVGQFEAAVAVGEDDVAAMQHVVRVILSSPQFLYRIEFDPDPTDPTPHALDAYELASRLSYALWASMPDEQLFELAASGALVEPETLEAEVDRMLGDDRAEALVKDFGAQWLGSGRLPEHAVSSTAYPSWQPELAASMQREMELFFGEFLLGTRPYSELLTADFNFVDDALADLYGVSEPALPFERVEITDDERRGFLGLAGFLTHTSRETRTSPIIRGTWVLNALLCQELSLPVGIVVEPLPEPAEGEEPATVRELMDQHRQSPACSGCHNLIDPIGLSLENFDGIGRFRSQYEGGEDIDAAGTLPDGTIVDSLESLSDAITADPGFVDCAARKVNIYALGRSVSDRGYLAQIVADWREGELTLRNLIKHTVLNDTFRMRRAEEL